MMERDNERAFNHCARVSKWTCFLPRRDRGKMDAAIMRSAPDESNYRVEIGSAAELWGYVNSWKLVWIRSKRGFLSGQTRHAFYLTALPCTRQLFRSCIRFE